MEVRHLADLLERRWQLSIIYAALGGAALQRVRGRRLGRPLCGCDAVFLARSAAGINEARI
jgi:hypothetical protein